MRSRRFRRSISERTARARSTRIPGTESGGASRGSSGASAFWTAPQPTAWATFLGKGAPGMAWKRRM